MPRSTCTTVSLLIWDTILLLFAGTTLALGALQISWEGRVVNAFHKNAGDGQIMQWPEFSMNATSHALAARPKYLMAGPSVAILANGIVAIVVATLFTMSLVTHLWHMWRSSETSEMINFFMSWPPLITLEAYACVSLAILQYSARRALVGSFILSVGTGIMAIVNFAKACSEVGDASSSHEAAESSYELPPYRE